MNKQTKLLYVAFLSITIFFSCSKDDNIDTSSDLYLSIPDKSFEKILIAKGIDSDGVVNQQMLRSDAENVQELDLDLSEIGVIQNLSGIEGFTSLKKLQANQHDIEEIDLSANRYLEEIHLAGNYLSSIDVSKNTNLISLDLTANLLTGITGLTELVKLENLNLSFNYFEELSINNQALEVLHIGNNDLISLDISTALNLINVLLTSNKLIALDISSNKKLQTLLVSGKVENVVGASWKGIDYLRIKPSSVANPRTEGQVNQRNKFTVTLEYLQPNLGFIKKGYKSYAVQKTEFNAAMSYVLNNAITGAAPNFTVDYSLALLSRGNLSIALNPATDFATAGQVEFTWDDNSAEGNANATDKAMILVYNPSKKESMYILDGADRTVGSQIITIPSTYAGDTVELFMAFITAEGNTMSNSVYLGSGTAN